MDKTACPHKTLLLRKMFLAAMAVAVGALVLITAATPQTAFGASYVVDTTSDANLTACTGAAGDCSLRGAINNANANAGADSITFSTGAGTITLGSSLPTLTNGGTNIQGGNIGIIVDGVTKTFNCFVVSGEAADDIVIRGLQIQRCSNGIRVQMGADKTFIGGTTSSERNVISDNGANGVEISGTSTNETKVVGNYIGTNSAGSAALANSNGVHIISGAQSTVVGGTTAGERNIISGNTNMGILIDGSFEQTGECSNAADDDNDGFVNDGCAQMGSPETGGQCSDALDNDADGFVNDGCPEVGSTVLNSVQGNYVGTNWDGTAAIGNSYGVLTTTTSTDNTIGGSVPGAGNVISGNNNNGIEFDCCGGNGVYGNYIGLNAAGTAALPNLNNGIHLFTSWNTIGGTSAAARNVISGNGGNGIENFYFGANVIQGNYIGTNAAGTAAVGNTLNGIKMDIAGSDTIGGTSAGARNVISGNTLDGVHITGGATSNTVEGNYIGTNSAGSAAVGNAQAGVWVDAPGNTIGGLAPATGAAPGNVISGNSSGIVIKFDSADGNVVQGNLIGTNAAGSAALSNTDAGVYFTFGPDGNTIGGAAAGARNVISGGLKGINLFDSGTTGNVIQGNYIGTDINGIADIGNTVGIDIGLGSTGNMIGGTANGQGNVIAFNDQSGICVSGSATTADIRGNSIRSNTLLGIDLISGAGACSTGTVTPNDAGDGDTGPNNLLNFPVITSATFNGTNTTVSGTLDTPSPDTAKVDVYASDAADPGGYGEGRAFIGTAIPNVGGSWSLTIPGAPPYRYITATATKSTSEFSAAVQVTDAPGAGLPSTAVAYKGQVSPIGSSYSVFGPGQVPNTSGTGEVVFWSSLLSGTQGIFRWVSPGPATKLVATGDAAPGGGTFTDLGDAPVVNEGGDIAFWAATSAPTEGIYRRTSAGAITKLVGVGDSAPGGSTFSSFDPPSGKGVAVINNGGDVSFWASLGSGGQGIYLRESIGTLVKVAATGDATPAGGTFSAFSSGYATIPIVTENEQVAFRGFTSGGPTSGVFLYTPGAGLAKVAATGDAAPTGGTFSTFGRAPSPNDSGEVAFWATLSGSALPNCGGETPACGVFVWDGGTVTKAFASGDPATPQTGGLISNIGTAPFMNDSGQITVWTAITGGLAGQALVRYTRGVSQNVAAIGNSTAIGGTFSDFIDPSGFPTNPLPNNQGRVAYWGDVLGGSGGEGVFITNAPGAGPQVTVAAVAGAKAPGTDGGTFGPGFDLDIDSGGKAVFAGAVEDGSASSGIFLFFAGDPSGCGRPEQHLCDVALQGQSAPGGGAFDQFHFPVNNDNGQIVVKATTTGEPGEGVYLFFAGSALPAPPTYRVRLAGKGESAPGGGGTYLFFAGSPSISAYPSINNAGYVASTATLSGGANGLYLFFAGSAPNGVDCIPIVSEGAQYKQCRLASSAGPEPVPGGGTYLFFAGSPSINDSGWVAQRAKLAPDGSGQEGLYLFFAGFAPPSGAICNPSSSLQQCKLAKTGDPAPGGGTFGSFGSPSINANGQVVVRATVNGGTDGLFLFFAGQPAIRLASVGSTFGSFQDAIINDNGFVLARATSNGKEGLFLFFAGNPALPAVTVALQGDPAATGSGTYGGATPVFPYMSMNNGDQVVYVANILGGSTSQGVFGAPMDFDGDDINDLIDLCPALASGDNADADGDGKGNPCDDDMDGDGMLNTTELACGVNPAKSWLHPERINVVGVNDDGDADGNDEALPPGASAFDCDGDGYKGSAETAIFAPSTQGDQDPCGTDGWPSDLVGPGQIFGPGVNIADLNTFLSPRRLDTNPGDANFNARWDLSPGMGIFGTWINIGDLNALLGGSSGFPPMLGGTRAFDGMDCPWPP